VQAVKRAANERAVTAFESPKPPALVKINGVPVLKHAAIRRRAFSQSWSCRVTATARCGDFSRKHTLSACRTARHRSASSAARCREP